MPTTYQTSVDIANRALQHCGARKIVSFSDDSVAAESVEFCYDKLREAELRRNVWRFSIRKAALRPVDTNTTQLAALAYNPATAYARGAVVAYGGHFWESQATGNTGNAPNLDASPWERYCGPRSIRLFVVGSGPTASDVSYYSGELVRGNGTNDTTTVYRSLVSDNSDVPPSANWLSLGAASGVLDFLYPVGAGPADNEDTRNVYLLPAGYLRDAPQDPKAGNISYLGAARGNPPNDWTYENDVIVSATFSLIVFRFAASITKVVNMDAMFCEGLGARIGLEVCEDVTQSTEKLQTIGAAYNRFMSEARTVNGIEQGPVESPEDDYVVCRI